MDHWRGQPERSNTADIIESGPLSRVLVLGSLAVQSDGEIIHVAGTQRRRLLALLASRPGRAVSSDAIIDALWGEDPPPSAAKTIQSHIVRLRRSIATLGTDVIATVPGGYRLDLASDDVDAARFERLADEGSAALSAGRTVEAAELLAAALALWRGPAYLEFAEDEFAQIEKARLDELRMQARQDEIEARLANGDGGSSVAELERLAREAPERERTWGLLMRALYADGRQQDALDAYERARATLVESFGLEPGPELREIEHQILQQDPVLASRGLRLPAELRSEDPFVGRRLELERLQAAWGRARVGHGQLRMVAGPVDCGRTRLAAELSSIVAADGGWVDHVRGVEGFADQPGPSVDAIVERCRRGPRLLIVDDAEWAAGPTLATVASLLAASERLSILVLVVFDPAAGGPAVDAWTRLDPTGEQTLRLEPMSDGEIIDLVEADGIDPSGASAIAAIAAGFPGVARREAAAWVERQASERLHDAARSSAEASSAADRAWANVTDEVRSLLRARARRDELVSVAWRGRQPYRALAAYGPEDAELFVGRERLVAELAARVIDRRLVAVVGPSGSGKSSLVRAGLLPLVSSGQLPGQRTWRVQTIVPGPRPLDALGALNELDEPGAQLLVIDQFEELFAADPSTVAQFVTRLVELVGDAALDVHIVLTLRADAYGQLTRVPELAALVDEAQVLVGPPAREEISRIVVEPARRTGCEVESDLVELVGADMALEPGALPLLSAAMAEVWERRDGTLLRTSSYTEIGGLAVAVERLGERAVDLVVAQTGPGGGELVRAAALRLVDVTEDGELVRTRVTLDDGPDDVEPGLAALIDTRLVTRRGDEVEITHDVVLRAWPRLVAWLTDARIDLVAQRELRLAARVWDGGGRTDDDLARGGRLQLAVERLAHDEARAVPVDPLVATFVGASADRAEHDAEQMRVRLEHEVRTRRRFGRLLGLAVALLVVALLAGVSAVLNTRRADDARSDALTASDDQRLGRLVAESGAEVDTHLDLALLLAAEAWRRSDTPATRGAMFTALTKNVTADEDRNGASPSHAGQLHRTNSSFVGFLSGSDQEVRDVEMSADGRIVASSGSRSGTVQGGEDGLVVVYDTTTRQLIGQFSASTSVDRLDVSADGATVAAIAGDRLLLHDIGSGSTDEVALPLAAGSELLSVSIRPDHDQVVVTASDGQIVLWDWRRGATADVPLPVPFGLARFLPDGRLVADRPGPGVVIWDVDAGHALLDVDLEVVPDVESFTSFSVSADGAWLAGSEQYGRVFIWDLRTGRLRGDASKRPGTVLSVDFSPATPSTLAIAGMDADVVFYDVAEERVIGSPLRGHGGGVSVGYSDDGRLLATGASDGLIGLWTDNGSDGLVATGSVDDARSPVLSGDGRWMLVRTFAGRLERRNATGTAPGVQITRPDGVPIGEPRALNHDGTRALLISGGPDPSLYVVAIDPDTGRTSMIWDDAGHRLGRGGDLSGDGRLLAAGTPDGTQLALVDLETGSWRAERPLGDVLRSGSVPLGAAHFSAGDTAVDVGLIGGVARFAADDLHLLSSATAPFTVTTGALEVPGTTDVIAGGAGGQFARWDLSTGELVATGRSADPSPVLDLAVSPDATTIAGYGLFSYHLALLDAATLQPIGRPMPVGDFVFVPQFSADSGSVVGNGLLGHVTRWGVEPSAWFDAACLAAGRNLSSAEWSTYLGESEPYRATCDRWPDGS